MSPLQMRVRTLLNQVGEPFTVGASTRRAVVSTLEPEQAREYLTDAALGGLGRPIRLFIVPHDDPAAVSDSISWQGTSLVVQKVVTSRHLGETVAKLVVAA